VWGTSRWTCSSQESSGGCHTAPCRCIGGWECTLQLVWPLVVVVWAGACCCQVAASIPCPLCRQRDVRSTEIDKVRSCAGLLHMRAAPRVGVGHHSKQASATACAHAPASSLPPPAWPAPRWSCTTASGRVMWWWRRCYLWGMHGPTSSPRPATSWASCTRAARPVGGGPCQDE
jgi:hypothetical protein